MVSGREVHKQIKSKMDEVRSNENSINSSISELEGLKIQQITQRDEAYIQLAKIYLPDLQQESIKSTLTDFQKEATAIFSAKRERIEFLDNKIDEFDQRKKTLEKQLEDIDGTISQREKFREDIESKIVTELGSIEIYNALKRQADHANERLKQNTNRLEAFEEDARSKIPEYENNKLFMYLVRRKFGTDEQAGNRLTKVLDSQVASIINYKEQKKNYDLLKNVPELIKEEIENQKNELNKLVEKMESVENEIEEKYRLPIIVNEIDLLEQSRRDISDSISINNNEYEHTFTQRKKLDSEDEYHAQAIGKINNLLKSESIKKLKDRARNTPDSRDDLLVERIEAFDTNILEYEREIESLIDKRSKVHSTLSGLEAIEREFRSNDYDSSRSVFNSGFDINDLITGYILGKMNSNNINERIRNNQRFKPRETSNYGSSSYGSSFGSSSHRSGGFGGFSSGGGFGGGFKSGGGFGGGFRSGKGF